MSVHLGKQEFADFRGAGSVECWNVPATVIPGDGVGAQLVDAAARLLAAPGQSEGSAAGLELPGEKAPLADHR